MLKQIGLIAAMVTGTFSLSACDTTQTVLYDDPGAPVVAGDAGNRDQVCAKLARELGYYGSNNYDDLHEDNPAMYRKVQSFKAHGCDK